MARSRKNEPVIEEVVVEEKNPSVNEVVEENNYKHSRKGTVVKCSVLNIREEASLNASILGQLKAGEVIDILDESGDFFKIDNGYVMKDYISVK